jgi:hypothetical protein
MRRRQDASDLLTRLASRDAVVRAEAARELAVMEPEGLAALFAAVERQDDRRGKIADATTLLVIVLACDVCVTDIVAPNRTGWSAQAYHAALFVVITCGTTERCSSALARRRTMRTALALADVADARSLFPLLCAMRDNRRLASVLERRVTEILSSAAECDIDSITLPTVSMLSDQIARSRNVRFVKAALSVLDRIGDWHALRQVDRLGYGQGETGDEPSVQDAARKCAASVRKRLAEQRATATLLRPASAPDDALLRPASASGDADVDVLLRPAEQEAPRDGS